MNRNDRQTRTQNRQPRTENRPTRTDGPTTGRTMRDVNHTHPFTERGALNRVFERGTRVAADGGERNAGAPERRESDARNPDEVADGEPGTDCDSGASAADDKTRMKDVDHTPPYGEGVDRVFERGGTEEPVEAEE
jgi:hypothetical protein